MHVREQGWQDDSLEEQLGYVFRDHGILREALTHASYANELGLPVLGERLEFLGDAVLELCVSEALYRKHPGYTEGELTKARAGIVCESALAAWAQQTRIPDLLSLGKGLERQGGRKNPSILADAAEAVLGAVFIDGGYEASRAVVEHILESANVPNREKNADPKSKLQELLQSRGEKPPSYHLVSRTGPDHAAVFRVELRSSAGESLASGSGSSIKAAEFVAAAAALSRLAAGEWEDPGEALYKEQRC